MSDTTDKYEDALDKLYFGENENVGFSLLDYGSDHFQQQLLSELGSGQSYIPEIEASGVNTVNDINNQTASSTLENVARESLLGTVGVYLNQNDKILKEVFSPYSSQVRNGQLTYGQAVTQSVNGGYSSVYSDALGKVAKSVIGLTIGLELAGSAIEVHQSGNPLNEAGKQAWGVAGGLAGGALGATAATAALALIGVTSAPVLLVGGGIASAAGWFGGEKYMEYAYDNLLPPILDAAGQGALSAAEIAATAFASAEAFVDGLWDQTGEEAADFFDLLTDGAEEVGQELIDLRDDYGWGFGQLVDELPDWLKEALGLMGEAELMASPLVLDLDNDGIELTNKDVVQNVFWDIDLDGFAEQTGWVAGEDGFLAIDSNNDGIITDHTELFGDQTGQNNGFDALALYDSNSDGIINSADTDFSNLLVWIDQNIDGTSQSSELYSLSALNITSIDLNYTNVNYALEGNEVRQESSFTINGQQQLVVDAYFRYSDVVTRYEGTQTIDAQTLFLPTLSGFGNLPSLHQSMSQDSADLPLIMVPVSELVSGHG